MGDKEEKIPSYILILLVLVVILVAVVYFFWVYAIPQIKQWGWGESPPPIIASTEYQTSQARSILDSYASEPGGYVFFKLCRTVDSCDVDLEFEDNYWKIRPHTEIVHADLDRPPYFILVNREELLNSKLGRDPPDFYSKWSGLQSDYSALVTSLKSSSSDYQTGVQKIVEFAKLRAGASSGYNLQIERRSSPFDKDKNFPSAEEAAELKLNAIVFLDELGKPEISSNIIDFTRDYAKFSRYSDSYDADYTNIKLNLLFFSKPDFSALQNYKARSDMKGVIVYGDMAQSTISELDSKIGAGGRKYFFVKGNLGDNAFQGSSEITTSIIGNPQNSFGIDSEYLRAKIYGKADSSGNAGSQMGSGMKSGKIIVEGDCGIQPGYGMNNSEIICGGKGWDIGKWMTNSIIKFTTWNADEASKELSKGIGSGEVWAKGASGLTRIYPSSFFWEKSDYNSPLIAVSVSSDNEGYYYQFVHIPKISNQGVWIVQKVDIYHNKAPLPAKWCSITLDNSQKVKSTAKTYAGEDLVLSKFPQSAYYNYDAGLQYLVESEFSVNVKSGAVPDSHHYLIVNNQGKDLASAHVAKTDITDTAKLIQKIKEWKNQLLDNSKSGVSIAGYGFGC